MLFIFMPFFKAEVNFNVISDMFSGGLGGGGVDAPKTTAQEGQNQPCWAIKIESLLNLYNIEKFDSTDVVTVKRWPGAKMLCYSCPPQI